jgi:hypothetical protein
MRHSYGHLVFDGREYIDAPNYPVDKRWAEQGGGYGYHHNASFRTAILGQAGTRTYFQPSGGTEATFNVKDVNIPLQAFGADEAAKTDEAKTAATPGGKYDALWGAAGQVIGVLGGGYMANRAAQKQAELAAQAQADAAKWAAVSGGGVQQQSSSGMSTVLIVGVLGAVALGAGYFLFKGEE